MNNLSIITLHSKLTYSTDTCENPQGCSCHLNPHGGIFVNLNPDLVDSHYDFEDSDESSDLVGLQMDERWLVLRVSFPNSPHSESITSSLLQGNGSAEE